MHGLCAALVSLGHDVHVFCTNVDGPGESDVPLCVPVDIDGVKVWYFPCRSSRRLFRSPEMKAELRKAVPDFDLIHLHSVFLWPTWVAARIARRSKIPYLISPRGMLVKDLVERKSKLLKLAWIRFIERRTFASADAVHVTTRKELHELRWFRLSLPPVLTVPNGIDESEVEPWVEVGESTEGQVFALFLGRINWKKGLDRLIRAWALVPGTKLIIAGNDESSYQRELECLAEEVGVSDRVRFIGFVEGCEKWRLFRQAALFILPSYSENFGNAVLEAMLMGCPVVVTPEVGLAETVAESNAGLVVDGDPVSLGAAIVDLLNNGEKRIEMGAVGQRVARDHYCWANVARQMVVGYEDVVAKHA